MSPPEAATETTPSMVGVEVQAGGGGVDGGAPAVVKHDVAVGSEDVDLGDEDGQTKHTTTSGDASAGGAKRVAEGGGPAEGPGKKKTRKAKPFRINLEPLPVPLPGDAAAEETVGGATGVTPGGEVHPGSALALAQLGERIPVDKPNGRYNKNGVCFHKASGKWRAIVYVNRKQVNLGYFATKEESQAQVLAAREHGLPKGFTNLRALQQPKRSEFPGVNWDKHCKRWLARVYEPSVGGKKGKEHKVGYFEDEKEAGEAVRQHRLKLGLPVGANTQPLSSVTSTTPIHSPQKKTSPFLPAFGSFS